MDEDNKYLSSLDEYLRQGSPSKRECAANWQTAIGLQAVDGLKPSEYLMDVARRNINGEISLDESRRLIDSYYESKAARNEVEKGEEEADKVSANIARILSSQTFALTTNGYISLHRRIFDGVFPHAGEIRDYDISKREWVLNGDSVNYLNWEDLRRALDWDISQEKSFSYKLLTKDEVVEHIAKFVSGIWQIHAFREGNTRTTAVFTVQYLRSMGFDIDNSMFALHSWYFRNALVRANYINVQNGIDYTPIYLERFFRNLLYGEHWSLKNRYLHIDAVQEQPVDGENVGSCVGSLTVAQLSDRQQKILKMIEDNPKISVAEMSVVLSVAKRTVERDLKAKRAVVRHEGNTSAGVWVILAE